MKGVRMKQQLAMSFSEIKGNDLEIPRVFMNDIFSKNKRVVIKEIENKKGIIVEAIDQNEIRSLVKLIRQLNKK